MAPDLSLTWGLPEQLYALDWAVAGGIMVGILDECLRTWRQDLRPRRVCRNVGDGVFVLLAGLILLASLYFGNWLALRLYALVGWGGGYLIYRYLGSPGVSRFMGCFLKVFLLARERKQEYKNR